MKRLWAPLAILVTMTGLGVGAFFWPGEKASDEPQAQPLPAQTEPPRMIAEHDPQAVDLSMRQLPPPHETIFRGNDNPREAATSKPTPAKPAAAPASSPPRSFDPFGPRSAAGGASASAGAGVKLVQHQEEISGAATAAPAQPSPRSVYQTAPGGDYGAASRYAPRVLPGDDPASTGGSAARGAAAMTNELRGGYGAAGAAPASSLDPPAAVATEGAVAAEVVAGQSPVDQGGAAGAPSAAPPSQPPSSRYGAPVGSQSVYGEAPAAAAANDQPAARVSVISAPEALSANEAAAPASDAAAAQPVEPQPLESQASELQTSESSASTALASAVPGAKKLEGQQTPALVIEKVTPAELQIGRPAVFQVKVRNVGQATANEVTVVDRTPKGTRLVEASPQPQVFADGALAWRWAQMQPGEEQIIQLTLVPEEEGEIGSVATVSFEAQASARCLCTRPLLTVEQTVPAKTLIGKNVVLNIKLTNPGTGAAANVILEENVPEGLAHAAGTELEYEVGTLKPGESRELQLTLRAAKAGMFQNVLSARADGVAKVEHQAPLEITAPAMEVAISGPARRYLQREATYVLSVANRGTAPAQALRLAARLPKGLKFVSTNNAGRYDATQHTVQWSLEELPAGELGEVELTVLPIDSGEQKLLVEGKGDLGLAHVAEKVVAVESLAELAFSVTDSADPIEVGKETFYVVKVVNNGTKAATGVKLTADLPADLKPLGGDGAAQAALRGQSVVFEPVSRLAPGEEAAFRVQAQGVKAGDHRIRVSLSSDESPAPVSKEESTRVYADE